MQIICFISKSAHDKANLWYWRIIPPSKLGRVYTFSQSIFPKNTSHRDPFQNTNSAYIHASIRKSTAKNIYRAQKDPKNVPWKLSARALNPCRCTTARARAHGCTKAQRRVSTYSAAAYIGITNGYNRCAVGIRIRRVCAIRDKETCQVYEPVSASPRLAHTRHFAGHWRIYARIYNIRIQEKVKGRRCARYDRHFITRYSLAICSSLYTYCIVRV